MEEIDGLVLHGFGFIELGGDLFEDLGGHAARVGGFDEDGTLADGAFADVAEAVEIGFFAVDDDVDDEAVFGFEMGEDLADGLEAEFVRLEGGIVDGYGHWCCSSRAADRSSRRYIGVNEAAREWVR